MGSTQEFMMNLTIPLVVRDGHTTLHVIMPGRISTVHQDMEAVASRHQSNEAWLRSVYKEAVEIRRYGEQASGWKPRKTMELVKELIESGWCDVIIVGYIRDIYRNPGMLWMFLFLCLDHKVRFISIYDNIDSADKSWQVMAHLGALVSGLMRPQVVELIRQKATYAFDKGSMVGKNRFGYRKLTKEEAASGKYGSVGLRIAKLPEYTAILLEMRRRVMNGDSYVVVAEWLIEEGITPGPYVEKWTGRVVKELLRDQILIGRRRYRNKMYTIVYGTGASRGEKNPS